MMNRTFLSALLIENKEQYVLDNFGERLEQAFINDRTTTGKATANQIVDKLSEFDPTPTNKYLVWIAKLYADGNLNSEDFFKLPEELEFFKRAQPKLEVKDIMRYETLPELSRALHHFRQTTKPEQLKSGKQKARDIRQQFLTSDQAELVYNKGGTKVVFVKTKEAACEFGKGTQWCTAATSSYNAFAEYHDLYIIFPSKKQVGAEPPFQFEIKTNKEKTKFAIGQIADATDDGLNIHELYKQVPQLFDILRVINKKTPLLFNSLTPYEHLFKTTFDKMSSQRQVQVYVSLILSNYGEVRLEMYDEDDEDFYDDIGVWAYKSTWPSIFQISKNLTAKQRFQAFKKDPETLFRIITAGGIPGKYKSNLAQTLTQLFSKDFIKLVKPNWFPANSLDIPGIRKLIEYCKNSDEIVLNLISSHPKIGMDVLGGRKRSVLKHIDKSKVEQALINFLSSSEHISAMHRDRSRNSLSSFISNLKQFSDSSKLKLQTVLRKVYIDVKSGNVKGRVYQVPPLSFIKTLYQAVGGTGTDLTKIKVEQNQQATAIAKLRKSNAYSINSDVLETLNRLLDEYLPEHDRDWDLDWFWTSKLPILNISKDDKPLKQSQNDYFIYPGATSFLFTLYANGKTWLWRLPYKETQNKKSVLADIENAQLFDLTKFAPEKFAKDFSRIKRYYNSKYAEKEITPAPEHTFMESAATGVNNTSKGISTMKLLKNAFKQTNKPIHEGRGVKVFRFKNITPKSRLRDYVMMESWGWEDVWEDMKTDHSIRRLVKDVKKLMYEDGWTVDRVAENLDFLIDRASTELTQEEKAVFLKWLEKNEEKIRGPERGLSAYNRQSAERHEKKDWDEFQRYVPEAVEPLDPSMDPEQQLEILTKRMHAARRGLGIANRLSSRESTMHRSRVMTNLNQIRNDLSQVIKQLESEGYWDVPTVRLRSNIPSRTTYLT